MARERGNGDSLVARNAAKGIKAPRPKKKEIAPLTPEGARAFLETARGDRFEALFVLALHCGLRESELSSRWTGTRKNWRFLSPSSKSSMPMRKPGRRSRTGSTGARRATSSELTLRC